MSQKNPKKASGPFIWRGPFIERTFIWRGVTPLFCTFFILYLYIIFFSWCRPEPQNGVFFNPNKGTGLKKHHFGACSGSPKKNYRGTRWEEGGTYSTPPPLEVILGHFGHLLGFPVNTVCNLSLPGIQASRENGTPPIGGHLRGPSEGQFCTPCVSGAQIAPREDI